MAKVALVYQPAVAGSRLLAEQCGAQARAQGFEPLLLSTTQLEPGLLCSADRLAVTFGGDGTILRVARWLSEVGVPIVGVQMGRLGFLAELQPADAVERLGSYLQGDYWEDRRAMLEGRVLSEPGPVEAARAFLALNDLVVSGGHPRRTVSVRVSIEGRPLHEFRCDGVILATATGSTAYSFAAGGPVLPPASRDLVVTPIAPHISILRSFLVSEQTAVELTIGAAETGEVSVDGQVDYPLAGGTIVSARVSSRTTVFARRGAPADLYSRILAKLR